MIHLSVYCFVLFLLVQPVYAARISGGGGGGGGGGANVSINGVPEANPNFSTGRDIRITNSSGVVTASPAYYLDVRDFGAVCDGVTNDAASIQAALTAVSNGGTVVVDGSNGLCAIGAPGIRLTGKTDVTVEGRNGGGFVAMASLETGGQTHSLTPGRYLWVIDAGVRITVRALRFQDAATPVQAGFLFAQCTECVIERNMLIGGGSGNTGSVNAQMMLRGGIRNIVQQNRFRDSNTGTGDNARCLWLGDNVAVARIEQDDIVRDNIVTGCRASAIVYNGTGGLLEGNIVETVGNGSGFSVASHVGTEQVHNQELKIVGNTVLNAAYHGIQLYASSVTNNGRNQRLTIANNTIRQANGAGIYLLNTTHATVTGNVIADVGNISSDAGIYVLGSSSDLVLAHNVLAGRAPDVNSTFRYGIRINASDAVTCERIVIQGNSITHAQYMGIEVATGSTGTVRNVQILDNNIHNTWNTSFGHGIRITGDAGASETITDVMIAGNTITSSAGFDIRLHATLDTATARIYVDPFTNRFTTAQNVGYTGVAVLADGTATPSVRYGTQWRVSSAVPRTITAFTNGRPGQFLYLLFDDANTTIQHGSTIQLAGAASYTAQANDILVLTLDGTVWREVTRSRVGGGGGGGIGGSTGSTDRAVILANGTGGSTIQGSLCTVSTTGQMNCPDGFVSGDTGIGIVTLREGAAPGPPAGAGQHRLYFDQADSALKSHEQGGSIVRYHSNATDLPFEQWLEVAACQNNVAQAIVDLPTANAPTVACNLSGERGHLNFDPNSDQVFNWRYRLPSGYTGLTLIFRYRVTSSDVTTFVRWCAQLASVGYGEASDPVLPARGTSNCITGPVYNTANREVEVMLSQPTCTACAEGRVVYGQIGRHGTDVSDTATGTAQLIGMTVIVTRRL